MSASAIRAMPKHQRPGRSGALGVSLAIIAVWALTGALLCGAVFASSLQPAVNPATAGPGPFPGGDWGLVMLVTSFPSLLLAPEMVFLWAVIMILVTAEPGRGADLNWADWGPAALAAGFMAAGAVMLGVLTIAARVADGPAPAEPTSAFGIARGV